MPFRQHLALDVPFWPQLPLYSYYEDMYVQASEHFPGIVLDMENRTLRFSMDKFVREVEETLAHFEDPDYFDISETYSIVYHRFLQMDFSDRRAIRGQLEGPVSFRLNVLDQAGRPILFDDTVRPFMLALREGRGGVVQQFPETHPGDVGGHAFRVFTRDKTCKQDGSQ